MTPAEVVTVVARERTSAALTRQEFRDLEASPDFWMLVRAGVVSLERTARNEYAVRGASYVGRALVGCRHLLVQEKIDGALAALLGCVTGVDAKVTGVTGFVDRSNILLERIAKLFLDDLGLYLLSGRRKAYLERRSIGPLPRGKVDQLRTMRVWSQGRVDKIAYITSDLSANLIENQLIGLALHYLDRSLVATGGSPTLLVRSRTIAVLFEDVDWPSFSSFPVERIAARFDEQLSSPRSISLGKLLSLARVFALHFGPNTWSDAERVPVSWFVNLESLFEEAVRETFIRVPTSAIRDTVFSGWQVATKSVIIDSAAYRAEPDVIGRSLGETWIIVDAKYKDFAIKPSRDDLYQLLAHARAYGAKTAVLAYPSSAYEIHHVGRSETGEQVYVALLDLNDLKQSVNRLLHDV